MKEASEEVVPSSCLKNYDSSPTNIESTPSPPPPKFESKVVTNPTNDSHLGGSNKFQEYIQHCVWPGLGLFGESYLLFSVGTLKPIWDSLYPSCLNGETCPSSIIRSLSLSVIIGVMIGMVLLGYIADGIGRRMGSIITAGLMSCGAIGLFLTSIFLSGGGGGKYNEDDGVQNGNEIMNDNEEENALRLFRTISILFFVFGLGVGGEYPLSASSASERAMEDMRKRQKEEEEDALEKNGLSSFSMSSTPYLNNHTNSQTDFGGRGKRVLLVFSMQGMGVFVHSLSLTFLLLIFGKNNDYYYYYYYEDIQNGNDNNQDAAVEVNYSKATLLSIWRIVYAIGALTLTYVFISRIFRLRESKAWAEDKQHRDRAEQTQKEGNIPEIPYTPPSVHTKGHGHTLQHTNDTNKSQDDHTLNPAIHVRFTFKNNNLMLQHYGYRLFGTCSTWLLWDVAFYGNKLFQSTFLLALTGEETNLFEVTAAAALNAFIALLGYFAAAFLVDKPYIGRLRLQTIGFLFTGTLFCICALFQNRLSSTFLILAYLGSSFFGQCGPNCTTFLLPAEIFPTQVRSLCHGLSASAGKLGALLAAILFASNGPFSGESSMFWMSGYCSFLACAITVFTIPDVTTLDLFELDKKWRMIVDGKEERYDGPADDYRHLSFIECGVAQHK